MWAMVKKLRDSGVTIILTTHYIEEAEEIADRVGVINNGELLLVEDKAALMQKLGSKRLTIELREPVEALPASLDSYQLERADDNRMLIYNYDTRSDRTGITALINSINEAGLTLRDIHTEQSSLEEIFVNLVKADA